jgi:hypothetical protein
MPDPQPILTCVINGVKIFLAEDEIWVSDASQSGTRACAVFSDSYDGGSVAVVPCSGDLRNKEDLHKMYEDKGLCVDDVISGIISFPYVESLQHECWLTGIRFMGGSRLDVYSADGRESETYWLLLSGLKDLCAEAIGAQYCDGCLRCFDGRSMHATAQGLFCEKCAYVCELCEARHAQRKPRKGSWQTEPVAINADVVGVNYKIRRGIKWISAIPVIKEMQNSSQESTPT